MKQGEAVSFTEYLDQVCAEIKWRAVHDGVRRELLSHLEAAVQERTKAGVPIAEAVTEAIHNMGDAVHLGQQLHKTHRPQRNLLLLAVVVLLTCTGLGWLQFLEAAGLLDESLQLLKKGMVFADCGTILLAALYFFDCRRIRFWALPLYVITVLLWIVTLLSGVKSNGGVFLVLPHITVNYPVLMPYLLTLALAGFFAAAKWTDRAWKCWAAVAFSVPLLLCLWSDNLAGGAMCTVVFLGMMKISGAGNRLVGLYFLLAVPWIGWLAASVGMSYSGMQGYLGGWNEYPAASIHTDLVFRHMLHAFGWPLGLAVVLAVAGLVTQLIRAANQIKDLFGRLAAGGLALCFAVQSAWHILMSLGLAPLAPVGLPFVSFGGSQMILQLAAMGIVLSVYRRKNLPGLLD